MGSALLPQPQQSSADRPEKMSHWWTFCLYPAPQKHTYIKTFFFFCWGDSYIILSCDLLRVKKVHLESISFVFVMEKEVSVCSPGLGLQTIHLRCLI